MQYLNASEYVSFGLDVDTADDLVVAASAMIDAFCRRDSLGITQYVERVRLRRGHEGQLSFLPLAPAADATSAVVSARGRRGEPSAFSPMACAAYAFGLAGTWEDVNSSSVMTTTDGLVQFQASWMGMAYVEAEVTYTAGYAVIPKAVKIACAQIVKNAQAMPALNVKRQAMNGMQMEYFQGALLDAEAQRLLQPYVVRRVG